MESIISKVHVELVDLAATYADAGYENVTLSLVFDFQRALFAILDEGIRIKDLEQSEGLKNEMENLFKDEYPTKPAWPYLNQLDRQDRCFAELGCRLKHGAALYKSPLCEEHFVCKNHQSSPCLAKHKHIQGQEHRAKDTKDARAKEALAKEALAKEALAKEAPANEAPANETPDTGNSAGKVPFVNQAKEADQQRGDKSVETGQPAEFQIKNVQYPWEDDFSHDQGSSSSEESEWDNNVVEEERVNQQNAEVGR